MADYKPSDLLKEKETAHYLSLADATLRNWRAAKKGPVFIKIGRSVRYRFSEIEAFIAASTAEVA